MSEPAPVLAVLAAGDPPVPDGTHGVTVRTAGPAGLAAVLPGADALLLWDFRAGDLDGALAAADRLRWVHVSSAGVDHVLTPALAASPVTVTNAGGVLDGSLAEYVLGLLLALVKDLPGTVLRQARQHWEHRSSGRLRGRRALVVGVGRIGTAVGELLAAVGVTVDGAGRTARAGSGPFGTVHAGHDLPRVAAGYDVLVLAAPLTGATRDLVDRRVLAATRPGTIVVNVARGELLDSDALLDALHDGHLGGAALDVFRDEPLPAGHPLWSAPRTIVSPHMAGDHHAWRADLRTVFLENLDRFVRGAPLRNVVDKELGYVPDDRARP